jgi:hypothetical protein
VATSSGIPRSTCCPSSSLPGRRLPARSSCTAIIRSMPPGPRPPIRAIGGRSMPGSPRLRVMRLRSARPGGQRVKRSRFSRGSVPITSQPTSPTPYGSTGAQQATTASLFITALRSCSRPPGSGRAVPGESRMGIIISVGSSGRMSITSRWTTAPIPTPWRGSIWNSAGRAQSGCSNTTRASGRRYASASGSMKTSSKTGAAWPSIWSMATIRPTPPRPEMPSNRGSCTCLSCSSSFSCGGKL